MFKSDEGSGVVIEGGSTLKIVLSFGVALLTGQMDEKWE